MLTTPPERMAHALSPRIIAGPCHPRDRPSCGKGATSVRFTKAGAGYSASMFVFFSNRLGCLGSLLVSVVATIIVIALLSH